jgi:alkyldihydroxyacetonephosphate synthase
LSDLLSRLGAALGPRVLTDDAARAAHARDRWVQGEIDDLQGRAGALPLAVVEPETTAEVASVMRLCRDARAPLIPYGGGSGVCGGVQAGAGAVVLSTRRLAGLVELRADDLVARFRAGTNGMAAEKRVQEAGLTIGHWPQSIDLATVGGLVATRSAGQYSTAYGNAEDVVLALEAVLPDGSVVRTRETPRAAAGPDLRQLFLGSEGLFGVITEVAFSLRPLPEATRGQAFHFGSFAAGVEALRLLLREGWRPPVARLYDASEGERAFTAWCPKGRAFLLLLHEGPAAQVELQLRAVGARCKEAGGVAADAAAAEHWLAHRNQVPSLRGFLEKGIVVDTIEVAATWSRVVPLYERLVGSLREVPGILAASAHSSHSYRSGTNLYVTFAARPAAREAMAATYAECWRRVMEATLEAGGGIAHHHGIGRVRRPWLAGELGPGGISALRALKRALDPENLVNPGVLLPDGGEA